MSNPQVELHIKNQGVITLELDQDKAQKWFVFLLG